MKVSRNSIWREHCTKEQAGRKLNTTFAITNPLKMPTLPDKPNYVNPISTSKEELLAAAEQLRTICSIKTADQIPPEKYDLPQTSSQEYGWVHKVRRTFTPRYVFPREAIERNRTFSVRASASVITCGSGN